MQLTYLAVTISGGFNITATFICFLSIFTVPEMLSLNLTDWYHTIFLQNKMMLIVTTKHPVSQVFRQPSIQTIVNPHLFVHPQHPLVLWFACTAKHICWRGLTIRKCCIHNNVNNSGEQ